MLDPATCRVRRWLVTCEPFSLTGSCKWVWSSVYCRKRCTWLWESSTAFFRWVTLFFFFFFFIKPWPFCHTPLPYQINTPIFFFSPLLKQDHPVPKKQLQLVGVTAMFLASKYEEMYPPEISDFAYVTDRAYTTAQIREMEMSILRVLKFQLGRPLPLQFLRRASKIYEVLPLWYSWSLTGNSVEMY